MESAEEFLYLVDALYDEEEGSEEASWVAKGGCRPMT